MKKRVLIVDDESAIREAVSFCLLANDYNVMLAPDGRSALSQIEHCRSEGKDVSAILLDMDMPVMSGEEFLHNACALGIGHPVILMSGSDKELARLVREHPLVVGYLSKPFTEEHLLEKISFIGGGGVI